MYVGLCNKTRISAVVLSLRVFEKNKSLNQPLESFNSVVKIFSLINVLIAVFKPR